MASNYWIKLYHEILDDDKIGMLRTTLKWRFVECLLVAGERDKEGRLPELAKMAWRLRCDAEKLETDLNELGDAGLLDLVDGCWNVTRCNQEVRRALSQTAKRAILERDKWTCVYCGENAAEVDHVVPIVQGGTNDPRNLAAACRRCNREKWDMTPEQWELINER